MAEVRPLPERHGVMIAWATDVATLEYAPVERIVSYDSADHLRGYVLGLADGRGCPIVYVSEPQKHTKDLVEYDETEVWWELQAAFVTLSLPDSTSDVDSRP